MLDLRHKFFNYFGTQFLSSNILIQWFLLAINIFFYYWYEEIIFFFCSGVILLSIIILMVKDYNYFNEKIKKDLNNLALSGYGVIIFDNQGEIFLINDYIKSILHNSEITDQWKNINTILGSISEKTSEKIKKNITITMETDGTTFYNDFINNINYQWVTEKIKYENQWLWILKLMEKNNQGNISTIHNIWIDSINKSHDIYLLVNEDYKIITSNNVGLELWNHTVNSIKYLDINQLIPQDYKILTSINENGTLTIKNNGYQWIKKKNKNGWLIIFSSIENEIKEQWDNFEQAIKYCPIPFLVIKDQKIIYSNESCKTIFLKSENNSTVESLLSEKHGKQLYQKSINGYYDWKIENLISDKFQQNIKEIRVFNEIIGNIIMVYIIDISSLFFQQKQLLHAQRLMTTGEILSGVIHDLNNYLMAILGYTENIFTKINIYDPIYNSMIHLQNNGVRAANLSKYLLNMGRKNHEVNNYINNLNLKIAELLRSMAKVITKNIEIKFKQSPNVHGISIGETLLEQILTNLLINSRDAINDRIDQDPNHKGLIYITTDLLKNYYDDKDGVQLKIYDNGKGISTTNIKKIFDPFYTTKDKNGIGLGLATVKNIIESHKGNITIDSKENNFTEFTIMIPSYEGLNKEEEKSPYITGNHPIVLDSGTILIVEDEISIRRLLKEHLTKNGYNVIDAENGQEALEKIKNINEIDVLVSDVMLPDISIVSMVKTIKEKFNNITIILSSGTTQDQVEDIIQNSFNYTFLNKPFPLQIIINTIKSLKNGKNKNS